MQRLRSVRSSRWLLGFYVACMALVVSFILFEVLDIDGSDFPTAPVRSIRNAAAAEEAHDLRRVVPHGNAALLVDVRPGLGSIVIEPPPLPRPVDAPVVRPLALARTHPLTLPRASLDVA